MAEPALGSRESRLLIVDDEKRHRDTLAAILEAEGFDVTACATAQEALAHLRRGGFGVAIVDLRLPDLSGTQLLEELQDLAGHVDVIIHTAYSSYESAWDAVNLGAFGYVEKGGDPGELVRHVHRASQARLRRYAEELESVVAERTRELQEANQALRREIAERKQAEAELRESEARYRTLFDAGQDGIFLFPVAADGTPLNFTEVNEVACRVLGYTRAELLAMSPADLVAPEYHRIMPGLGSSLIADRCFRAEWEGIAKDGRRIPVDASATLFELGGQPIGMAVVRDMAERKQAEEALRIAEERFSKAFRASPDAMTISRMADGTLLEVNDMWGKALGYSRAESVGTSSIALGIWCDPAIRQQAVQQLQETGSLRDFEVDLRRKTGEVRQVSLSSERLEIGGEQCLLTIIHDITERKQAEEALRESEARLRMALDSATAIAWEQDLVTGALIEAGPVELLFGRPEGFRHTSQQDFVESVHPDDRERLRAGLEAAARSKSPYEVEFRVPMPDGGVRWLRATGDFAYDSEGRTTILRGIARDVTERKRLEREVLEISDAERRRIGCELHDGVRQELAGIRYMAGALAQRLAARAAPEAEDAEAITRLLDEAAEHTRTLARGMCPLELVYADFLPALEQLALTARDRFHIACDLRCDVLPDGINDTMATHLYHIAQEAVANAVEHGKAKHVEIALAAEGGAATLTVKGDGLGLPDGLDGLKGLGLRIMRYRADVMGASLDVRRQAEGGTIVACSIPLGAREGEGGEGRTGASRSDG